MASIEGAGGGVNEGPVSTAIGVCSASRIGRGERSTYNERIAPPFDSAHGAHLGYGKPRAVRHFAPDSLRRFTEDVFRRSARPRGRPITRTISSSEPRGVDTHGIPRVSPPTSCVSRKADQSQAKSRW